MGLKPVKSFHVTVSPYLSAGAKNVIMTSLMFFYVAWLLFRTSTSAITAGLICGRIPGLTNKQKNLCSSKPDAMVGCNSF